MGINCGDLENKARRALRTPTENWFLRLQCLIVTAGPPPAGSGPRSAPAGGEERSNGWTPQRVPAVGRGRFATCQLWELYWNRTGTGKAPAAGE
ncbi:hypothetical protein [Kamptonema formosum]|uniref:hypothetical protein n=1 Tax=Kamptonema formosum TaxID=331992 RepID=UPI0012DE5467|nr:hypothetical protein [Oscillatoria sp. PCC 10802]